MSRISVQSLVSAQWYLLSCDSSSLQIYRAEQVTARWFIKCLSLPFLEVCKRCHFICSGRSQKPGQEWSIPKDQGCFLLLRTLAEEAPPLAPWSSCPLDYSGNRQQCWWLWAFFCPLSLPWMFVCLCIYSLHICEYINVNLFEYMLCANINIFMWIYKIYSIYSYINIHINICVNNMYICV